MTRFDESGAPTHAVARVLLERPRAVGLTAEAERIFASLKAECSGLLIVRDAVEATLSGPWSEPGRAESLWRSLVRLAQAL